MPHISGDGASEVQTAGRRGSPNNAQVSSVVNCTQRTPAGLPSGMPGIGVDIEGAVQHAAQRGRQSIGSIVMAAVAPLTTRARCVDFARAA
jgi:hypothetical protein